MSAQGGLPRLVLPDTPLPRGQSDRCKNNYLAVRRHEGQAKADLISLRVPLHWRERQNDIASKWVHRESKLMFTLSSMKGQRKKFIFAFALLPYVYL